jgi:hypothetical protein
MNRPGTFTLLSIISFLLTFGGLAVAWANLTGSTDTASIALGLIASAYAIAAATTAIGLWWCKKWTALAFRVWAITFVFFVLAFVYFYKSMFVDSLLAVTGFLLLVVVISVMLDKYVRRKLPVAT